MKPTIFKNVFCFDIDGSIMPNIFQNYGWDEEQDRETVIREVNKNGKDVPLFPNFIEYYKTMCKDAQKIYFITGRQEEEFQELTLINLKPILEPQYDFTIIWYPPDKKHKPKPYFNWKITTIKKIMKGYTDSGKKYGLRFTFCIYDDWDKHFPKIRKYARRHRISTFLGKKQSNEDWKI